MSYSLHVWATGYTSYIQIVLIVIVILIDLYLYNNNNNSNSHQKITKLINSNISGIGSTIMLYEYLPKISYT